MQMKNFPRVQLYFDLCSTRKISQDFPGLFGVTIDFPYFPEITMLSRDFSCLFCLCVQMALALYVKID